VRHRQTKGSATDRLHLNHRATPRLHTSSSQYELAPLALNRNSLSELSSINLSGLIAAAGFPPVDRPLHTWQHLQQETNRCSRGNACRQSQWDRLAEEERTPTVLSEGPCLLERNKPPSHSQQESPQQPISRFGISCGTSRCLGRIVSQSSASVRSTPDLSQPETRVLDRAYRIRSKAGSCRPSVLFVPIKPSRGLQRRKSTGLRS